MWLTSPGCHRHLLVTSLLTVTYMSWASPAGYPLSCPGACAFCNFNAITSLPHPCHLLVIVLLAWAVRGLCQSRRLQVRPEACASLPSRPWQGALRCMSPACYCHHARCAFRGTMRVPFFQQTTLCRGFELTGQQGHEVTTRGAHLGGFLHTHADKTRTGRQTLINLMESHIKTRQARTIMF